MLEGSTRARVKARFGTETETVTGSSTVKLAHDMATIEPRFSRTYKRLINDGYALPFGEAMALEERLSTEANAKVSAADVEAARGAVQARGRQQ